MNLSARNPRYFGNSSNANICLTHSKGSPQGFQALDAIATAIQQDYRCTRSQWKHARSKNPVTGNAPRC